MRAGKNARLLSQHAGGHTWAAPTESKLRESIVIFSDRGYGWFLIVEGKAVGKFDSAVKARKAALWWQRKNRMYLDMFVINDDGNIKLIDSRGRTDRSWV